jgi:uncharacterized protein with ParB-like and HNH nuclease domain
MANELVFSIERIFSSGAHDSILKQYNATRYYIPPYQRGYKWQALEENDAVCLLLKDLIDAQCSASEYYLQFITLKTTDLENENLLEIIDGQQRLTSLTLLISVLVDLSDGALQNIAKDKIYYKVRPLVSRFFEEFIYRDISQLFDADWKEFIHEYQEYDEQDIFYLFHAIGKIYQTFEEFTVEEMGAFYQYLVSQVKIVATHVKDNVNCEKIFANLNDNKVELTNAELIKGLLLTNAPRQNQGRRARSFREIIELRSLMGRRWDEIAIWADKAEPSLVLANPDSNDSLSQLLLLLGLFNQYKGANNVTSDKGLFNYLQSEVKRGRSADTFFQELDELQRRINDWLSDPEIFNLLGYLLTARSKSKFALSGMLRQFRESKAELKLFLKEKVIELVPEDISELDYNSDYDDIWNILLALNVFGEDRKFDFPSFVRHKWQLEHIFPKNPKAVKSELYEADIELYNNLMAASERTIDTVNLNGYSREYLQILHELLKRKMADPPCRLTEEECQLLYQLIKSDSLNSLGNLAFLDGSTNGSIGNGMFNAKRKSIVKKISNGTFVPKHTYDVFAKLLSPNMDGQFTSWSTNDMTAHLQWIIEKIQKIKTTGL